MSEGRVIAVWFDPEKQELVITDKVPPASFDGEIFHDIIKVRFELSK